MENFLVLEASLPHQWDCIPSFMMLPSLNRYLHNTNKYQADLVGWYISMSDKGLYKIVANAVMLMHANTQYGPWLMNCYLPVVPSMLVNSMQHSQGHMNLGQWYWGRFDGSNHSGIFLCQLPALPPLFLGSRIKAGCTPNKSLELSLGKSTGNRIKCVHYAFN